MKLNNLLNNFDLDIEKGSFIVITGPLASGKTTVLKEIYEQVEKKYNSSLVIDEMIFHHTMVKDELIYCLENKNVSKKEIKSRIKRVLNRFEIYDYLYNDIESLSFVDKKRLALALATITNPDILLLDNPFINFSSIEEKRIVSYLKSLSHKGMTIIITTNNAEEYIIGDKLLVLKSFEKVTYDKPIRIFSDAKIIKKLNIELPFMVDLSLKLKFYDLVKKVELDMEKMVDSLWK